MDFKGKHILFLDGYTSQCLEYLKSMKKLGCRTSVLCGSVLDVCYVSRYPDCKILGVCSPDRSRESEEWIMKLVCSRCYDMVIAFTEYSAAILSSRKEELSPFARIVVNDAAPFAFAQNKNNVMKVCMENNIPCPYTLFGAESVNDILSSEISFPIILKPDHGYGARGFHIAESPEALAALVKERGIKLSDTVVQEYLPKGSLVLSDNIFIDRNYRIQSSFLYGSYRTYPPEGGSGVLNITIDRPDVHESCARLVKLLGLRGPVGVDLMIDARDNRAKVLEINLRPLACAKLGFLAGVDTARQVLEDAFSDSVTPMMSYKTGIRVRRSQIDLLWFIKSPDRFRAEPSWFSWKNTRDQLFSFRDPLPWFAFSINGILNLKKETEARS